MVRIIAPRVISEHCCGALRCLLAVLDRRIPVLAAVQFGVPNGDAAIALAHSFERAELPIDAVVKARRLDKARMAPPIENNAGDVAIGLESIGAEQANHLPAHA